jgi:hypothetical protein
MNNYHFENSGRHYSRVSKRYARKHYKTEVIHMCPVNIVPGGNWASDMRIFCHPDHNEEIHGNEFDYFVREFIWLNCQWSETGYYPAFYRVEEARHE